LVFVVLGLECHFLDRRALKIESRVQTHNKWPLRPLKSVAGRVKSTRPKAER
jgi:hypothetical protein